MNNDSILRYFRIAKECSELSDFRGVKRVKIGCVLVYKNRIISSAYNTSKTSPKMKELNRYRNFDEELSMPSLHAEASAILKVKEYIDWSKVHIFVYREYKNGQLALAKPCNGCMRLIRSKGIKHIHYTGDKSYCHEELVY